MNTFYVDGKAAQMPSPLPFETWQENTSYDDEPGKSERSGKISSMIEMCTAKLLDQITDP